MAILLAAVLSPAVSTAGEKATPLLQKTAARDTAKAEPETAGIPGACSADFARSLGAIAEEEGARLKQALKSVRRGWRSLPGRWLFRPAGTGPIARSANTLVRYRGADAQLRQAVQSSAVARAATELNLYLSQQATPALCTGADRFMDFFEAKLADLFRDHDSRKTLASEAAEAAEAALAAAERALAAIENVPDGDRDEEAVARASRIGGILTEARALTASLSDAQATPDALPDQIARLAEANTLLGKTAPGRTGPFADLVRAVGTALSAVEALAYMRSAEAQYEEVAGGFLKLTGAVRSAHAKTCVCSSE